MEILSGGDYAPAEIFHTFLSPPFTCQVVSSNLSTGYWAGGVRPVCHRLLPSPPFTCHRLLPVTAFYLSPPFTLSVTAFYQMMDGEASCGWF